MVVELRVVVVVVIVRSGGLVRRETVEACGDAVDCSRNGGGYRGEQW